MKIRIIILVTIVFSLMFSPSLISNADARIELSENEYQQIKVDLAGTSLYVTGAAGKTLYIYNLIGMKLLSIKIESNDKKIELSDLKKNVILVKVGNISKKLNLPVR